MDDANESVIRMGNGYIDYASDHKGMNATILMNKLSRNSRENPQWCQVRGASYNFRKLPIGELSRTLETQLQTLQAQHQIKYETPVDIEEAIHVLTTFTVNEAHKLAPVPTFVKRSQPWWTPDLSTMGKQLGQMEPGLSRRRFLRLFQKRIRKAKRRYNNNIFAACKDTSEMWKIYNTISVKGKSKQQQQQGTFITTPHSNTTDTTPTRNLHYHQQQIMQKTFHSYELLPGTPYKHFLYCARHEHFVQLRKNRKYWRRLSMKEVDWVIANLKTGKAPGPDTLRAELIKKLWNLSPTWKKIFFSILSKCIKHAYHPFAWRYSTTLSILKDGRSGEIAKDYRPISLLNTSSKILEDIVLHRLTLFTEENKILPPNQCGARPGYSAIDPVLKMVHDLKVHNGAGSALFMDIQGAYDNALHPSNESGNGNSSG
ncbi:unnamed protein product [Ambrosiozyma monospora]|uniref:Unnamed protein product n=1 Tax=Ambrosiozyma monospora TaxID=43982 RepID=A0A9W6YRI1_AMBMO|nr:unnamed protein product [Ambrosiozyma monospora]